MDNPEFPPNSQASKRLTEDKNIQRVTTGEVTRKRRSLRKQFKETFVAGDPRGVVQYVLLEVALPAAQDLVIDTGLAALERIFKGGSRRRPRVPPSGPYGRVDYSSYSRDARYVGPSSSQRVLSRQARARHNFDEIVLDDRTEAEEVIDRLFELVSQYGGASVADLYELVGLSSSHTDNKWGWTDLHGAGVSRIRGGYLLDLPEPHPLD